jgi:hypothetical protein
MAAHVSHDSRSLAALLQPAQDTADLVRRLLCRLAQIFVQRLGQEFKRLGRLGFHFRVQLHQRFGAIVFKRLTNGCKWRAFQAGTAALQSLQNLLKSLLGHFTPLGSQNCLEFVPLQEGLPGQSVPARAEIAVEPLHRLLKVGASGFEFGLADRLKRLPSTAGDLRQLRAVGRSRLESCPVGRGGERHLTISHFAQRR